MVTNTKQTPKSCCCWCCQRGKHSSGGHALMKYDERAYRHSAKIKLAEDAENAVINSAPIGNYFD